MTGYSRVFFRSTHEGSVRSAEVIVPIVVELIRPHSVVDVGCGQGIWLSVFEELGVDDYVGVDGDYIDRRALSIPEDRFIAHDLGTPLRFPRTFDLVVSLEVAEHLPEDSGPAFVDSLTGLGPAVLFSAAIPRQGGTRHVNERWQDYWAALFAQRDFEPLDAIRWRVWTNEQVEPWYAQNTLLYVARELLAERMELQSERRPRLDELRVVHPGFYLRACDSRPGLRFLLASIPGAVGRAVRRRLTVARRG